MDKKYFEKMLGIEIEERTFQNAEKMALRKLQQLIRYHGDDSGVRRTHAYLIELVIEAIKSELLTEHSIMTASL